VGNSDLKGAANDPNVRYLALTGVLAYRRHHDNTICAGIERVKQILPSHTPHDPVLLHRREIVRREGHFAVLHDEEIANEFNRALLHFLESAPYLAITVQIDKLLHLRNYDVWHFDPYHYCLRCLIERYVLYLRRHNKLGDVVIEPRYKKADKALKLSFAHIYEHGTEHLPRSVIQAHLLSKDIQFFQKSANIAGLQIADLLGHPSARRMRFERDGIPAPKDFGELIAGILVRRRYVRNPATSQISGWGQKWLP
jgi:Protein of unknown function (DUF3800)